MNIKISIIIPCLNEEKNITRIYKEIKKKFERRDYEIIYVDDGSKDNSRNEILALSKQFKNVRYLFRNKDKDLSRSFFAAVELSKSNYIILMDCDLQHDPEILNKLYSEVSNKNLSIVSGSRFMKRSINNTKKIKYIFRLILSRILNWTINFILDTKLTDPLTGIFISDRKKILKQKKNLYLNGYKIFLDFYTTIKTTKKHTEIPIILNERINGESKLSLKTLINILKLILYKKFKLYRQFF